MKMLQTMSSHAAFVNSTIVTVWLEDCISSLGPTLKIFSTSKYARDLTKFISVLTELGIFQNVDGKTMLSRWVLGIWKGRSRDMASIFGSCSGDVQEVCSLLCSGSFGGPSL